LGISHTAELHDLSEAYRRLCRKYHPDVSREPDCEERMKQINVAYAALCGSAGTAAAPSAAARANTRADARRETSPREVLTRYFDCLKRRDHVSAYELLSERDRRYVTFASFDEWRKSVSLVFAMRDFRIDASGRGANAVSRDGTPLLAREYGVEIVEERLSDGETRRENTVKLAVNEGGKWRVFLGISDIDGIAAVFRELFEIERTVTRTARSRETRDGTDERLQMRNAAGLLREGTRETHRIARYGGDMTLAVFTVRGLKSGGDETLTSVSRALIGGLRETDIAGYLGDGMFAVLLVEMKKKHISAVTGRLTRSLNSAARAVRDARCSVECVTARYMGRGLASELTELTGGRFCENREDKAWRR
jgi:hypothetical protein